MADFPISPVVRRVVYTGSAGTGPYAFTFEILAQTDIDVYVDATLKTLTTDYTVTVNSNGTGAVNFVTAPGSTKRITIVGARDITRASDYVTGGDFTAASLNVELDQQTIFNQQNAEALGRAILAPVTDPDSINMVLPVQTSRAGKTLAFDSNGNPVVGEDIGNYRGNWTVGLALVVRDLVDVTAIDNRVLRMGEVERQLHAERKLQGRPAVRQNVRGELVVSEMPLVPDQGAAEGEPRPDRVGRKLGRQCPPDGSLEGLVAVTAERQSPLEMFEAVVDRGAEDQGRGC